MLNRPKVGIGVLVLKDNKILLGKRKNAHGEGCWSYPGGHLEFGESWEECSRREIREEVGIEIKNIRFGSVTNDIFENEQKHYITICMLSDFDSGEIQLLEPDKCEELQWFEWDHLSHPLFLPTINQLIAGFNPMKPL